MQTTRPPHGLLVGIHGRGRCRSSIRPSGSSKGQRHARLISSHSHGRTAASYRSRPGKACPPAAQLVLALTAAKPRSSSRRPLLWPGARRSRGAPPGGRSCGPELTSPQPPAHGVAQGRRRSSGHAARHRHRHKQQGIVQAEEQERAHAGGMSPPRGGTTRGGRPQQPDEQRGPARAWRGSEGAAR